MTTDATTFAGGVLATSRLTAGQVYRVTVERRGTLFGVEAALGALVTQLIQRLAATGFALVVSPHSVVRSDTVATLHLRTLGTATGRTAGEMVSAIERTASVTVRRIELANSTGGVSAADERKAAKTTTAEVARQDAESGSPFTALGKLAGMTKLLLAAVVILGVVYLVRQGKALAA